MAFKCTLLDEIIVAADGHTYNRADIETWLREHDNSPLTNGTLEHKMLIPNLAVCRQINAWREQYGHPAIIIGQPAKFKAGGGSHTRCRSNSQTGSRVRVLEEAYRRFLISSAKKLCI